MRVALTFHAEHPDRPVGCAGTQEQLVDLLTSLEVRASFFMQGRWVEAYPDTARRIAREGHVVGNHSFYHVPMSLLSAAGLSADLTKSDRVIADAVGVEARPWFRCPFGDGWNDPAVAGALVEAGYRHVGWDVVGYDWEPGPSPEPLAKRVAKHVLACDGEAVVLLHAWPDWTLAALPDLIGSLRASGAEFVGIDGLDRVPAAAEF